MCFYIPHEIICFEGVAINGFCFCYYQYFLFIGAKNITINIICKANILSFEGACIEQCAGGFAGKEVVLNNPVILQSGVVLAILLEVKSFTIFAEKIFFTDMIILFY